MIALLAALVLTQADAGTIEVSETSYDAGTQVPDTSHAVADAGTVLGDLKFTPLVDAIAEYGARWPSEAPSFNAFSVPRIHAGLEAEWRGAQARVLLESVYATQGGALLGVAGDSLVLRLREAWGGYRWRFLEARLGVIPTLTVPELERAWHFRQLAADGLETFRLVPPADLGASLRAHLGDFGWAGVTLTNGEGYTSRELNPSKNVEVAAAIHPLPKGSLAPLSLLASVNAGSAGLPEVATIRYGGALLWNGERFGAGASVFALRGQLADSKRLGWLGQGFLRAKLFEHLLLAARATYWNRELGTDDGQLDLVGSVGVALPLVEVMVAVDRTVLMGAARNALPGVDGLGVRLVVRAKWPEAR